MHGMQWSDILLMHSRIFLNLSALISKNEFTSTVRLSAVTPFAKSLLILRDQSLTSVSHALEIEREGNLDCWNGKSLRSYRTSYKGCFKGLLPDYRVSNQSASPTGKLLWAAI